MAIMEATEDDEGTGGGWSTFVVVEVVVDVVGSSGLGSSSGRGEEEAPNVKTPDTTEEDWGVGGCGGGGGMRGSVWSNDWLVLALVVVGVTVGIGGGAAKMLGLNSTEAKARIIDDSELGPEPEYTFNEGDSLTDSRGSDAVFLLVPNDGLSRIIPSPRSTRHTVFTSTKLAGGRPDLAWMVCTDASKSPNRQGPRFRSCNTAVVINNAPSGALVTISSGEQVRFCPRFPPSNDSDDDAPPPNVPSDDDVMDRASGSSAGATDSSSSSSMISSSSSSSSSIISSSSSCTWPFITFPSCPTTTPSSCGGWW